MNSHLKCVVIFWIYVCANCAWADTPNATLPLQISMHSEGFTNKGASIKISLTNISAHPIQMYDIQTPWALRINLLLVATTKQSWENLRSAGFAVEDPVNVKIIQIAPGETISGTVQLTDYVDYVDLRKKKEDLLVFWHFVAKGAERDMLGEYGGWVTIPYKKG